MAAASSSARMRERKEVCALGGVLHMAIGCPAGSGRSVVMQGKVMWRKTPSARGVGFTDVHELPQAIIGEVVLVQPKGVALLLRGMSADI